MCSECAVIQSGTSFCRWEQGRCLSQSKDCCEPGSADNCCECPDLFVSSTSHCYLRNRLFFPTKDLPLPVVLQLCTVQIAQYLKKTGKKLRNLPTGWVHLVQYSIFAYFLDCATKTPVIRHFFQEELGEGRSWKALAWLASKSIRAHLPYRHWGCCIWSTCSVLQDLFPCLPACDHSTSATKLGLRKDESVTLLSSAHQSIVHYPAFLWQVPEPVLEQEGFASCELAGFVGCL